MLRVENKVKFDINVGTFRMYVPKSLLYSQDTLDFLHMNVGQDFDNDFEPESNKKRESRIIEHELTLQDIVNLRALSHRVWFVRVEIVPFFYEVLIATIRIMEKRIGLPDFNMVIMNQFYDLADTIYEDYNLRLRIHLFENMVKENAKLKQINFVGIKNEMTPETMEFPRVERRTVDKPEFPIESKSQYVVPEPPAGKKWI